MRKKMNLVTPLTVPTWRAKLEAMEKLLKQGAFGNDKHGIGKSPINCSAEIGFQRVSRECIYQALLHINSINDGPNKTMVRLLNLASAMESTYCMKRKCLDVQSLLSQAWRQISFVPVSSFLSLIETYRRGSIKWTQSRASICRW